MELWQRNVRIVRKVSQYFSTLRNRLR
ncbi:hypothetical protein OH492_07360 [Vibrio chagasii]|nr:hypothetical protein [Vibrio chagasii]